MLITQPALICLETTWRRLIGRSPEDEPQLLTHSPEDAGELPASLLASVAGEIPETRPPALPAEIAGDLVSADAEGSAPLTASERRARAAALRALALSRGRRFASAQTAFAEAARLDPTLDLTRVPGFWRLERAAHEAAIDAYDEAGRARDAAVLRARVRSTFRPKPVRNPQVAAFATVKQ
jgi:hypothetical protein